MISFFIVFSQYIIVDARAHLLGRLASTIAKQLLNGKHIHVVRAEGINISGSREYSISMRHYEND